ncbi:ATP-binding protein [Archangium lipolyticum]|uniref:ATP-binding protein n=1 Tax=Archangium lipolyticum TaxID=2970465 RepID=UPI002149E667|nr:ATP-binding protein [Archangium lipolyticum]
MGELMRALDWSRTPVGPVETWPQSLRTVLSILLTSRHPIFVWWGKELVQFYNDGYRPILGATKHPRGLGQRGREGWTEVWDVIGPMIEAVMERGESTFIEDGLLCLDRNGYVEEAYFTYAYSPIRDESGGIGGIFCACTETTERILGERRLQMLRELSEVSGEQKSAEEGCRKAARVLASNPHDVPFALLYLTEARGGAAQLVATVGVEPGSTAAPSRLDAGDASAPWSWASVESTGQAVLLATLPPSLGTLPGGPWPEAASSALVLPLSKPGHDKPAGMLVVGISPRKALDVKYRGFLELTATHIANLITNARAYEEEKRRAEALAELDRAKTDFFSNVSHEFRTPLTLLLGPVEEGLMDAEQPLPPRQRERQEAVHRNGLRLLKLVNTLLDFSRLEAGRVQASFRPTDLSALTEDLASTFRSTLERAGLRLVVDCPPLPGPVYVDEEMWEKVVLNLLSNAFKFTLEGEIRVALSLQGESVRLTVADTGTGIPSHELPHLFERFHRVRGAKGRTNEGSGIGLALVKELVKLHGGTVEVQSTLDQGSTFTVSLPLGSAHLPPEHIQAASPLSSTRLGRAPFLEEAAQWGDAAVPEARVVRQGGQGPERILLVDDNADMRAYVQRLLGEHWTVEAVSNGVAALAAARERTPHLVVSDVMMPGLDGFGLLRELRADPRTASIPVILLSARAGEEASIEGMRAGADDYLVKPFSARELVSRVGARLEIARAHAETRNARARLHEQLMQAPVGVCFFTGPELAYEFANPRYLEMVGRQEDLIGKPMRKAYPELPDDAAVFQMLEGVYTSGQTFTSDDFRVPLDRRGNGVPEDVYFQLTCQPMRDATGTIVGVMAVAVDVTPQVLARNQVEKLAAAEHEARGRAEDADRRKDEFLAMLAHELRNPLAALSTALEMMGRVQGDEAREARLRETCRRQVINLVRLVDDLLDVSRITRGKVELRRKEVDFTSIVQNAIGTSRSQIDGRGHELTVTFGPGDFRMEADATRLEQVVSNLLTNAAKYTEPGGHISVRVGREERQGVPWAVLHVRDTGRGIPPDMLDKVFEMFVQVDKSIDRAGGGLGIGLTLVERLVGMHGGTITARSEGLGRGSEFIVRLPLSRQAPLAVQTPSFLPLAAPASPRKRRVLLVEDSPDVREMMQELLEELGHEVEVATNGLEGAAKVLDVRPDVALVDVGLPGIDGYEVARRVRASKDGGSFYLVALTGYGGSEARSKALEAGFDVHLVKPIDVDDLPRVLEGSRRDAPT